jgi:arylsulfatase A-like enzyme
MVIAGAGVNRKGVRETALIQSTDLFTTIAQIAGAGITEKHNSKSFYSLLSNANAPTRAYAYAEKSLNGAVSYAVRDDEYKLIVEDDGTELLYNLSNDAYENTNLLNNPSGGVETIKNTLLEEAARIRN